jgi:uncharacterized SAM-binding protein YcdF (DUF218 family)
VKSRSRGGGELPLLVVHGHRDGNAVGGPAEISSECVARVRAAEQAARRYRSELVLFCGAGAPGHPSEARQMAAIWEGAQVQAFLDERSADTAENASEARRWFHALGASALIVVSSWWHVRLLGYYGGPAFRGIPVGHVRTTRCDRVFSHLAHELRYAPRVWRLRNARPDRRRTALDITASDSTDDQARGIDAGPGAL